jgi:hypothetical protein
VTRAKLYRINSKQINSENACCRSVQDLLSPFPLSKILNIKICKTVISPVESDRCGTWPLILREGYRLRVFKNKVPTRIFGHKRDYITKD